MTSKRMGRPPNNPPDLAYVWRRPIFLVQVLAEIQTREWSNALSDICEKWQIEPVMEYKLDRINFSATLQKVAQHALEVSRNREDEEELA